MQHNRMENLLIQNSRLNEGFLYYSVLQGESQPRTHQDTDILYFKKSNVHLLSD